MEYQGSLRRPTQTYRSLQAVDSYPVSSTAAWKEDPGSFNATMYGSGNRVGW